MDLPLSVKGLAAMRLGVGVSAIVAPSVLARLLGLSPADARTPAALMSSTFFGIRELALTGITVGASAAEPRALRRLLLVCAATDGLDLVLTGARAVRQPALRRPVLLFGPGAAISVLLHVSAARKLEVMP